MLHLLFLPPFGLAILIFSVNCLYCVWVSYCSEKVVFPKYIYIHINFIRLFSEKKKMNSRICVAVRKRPIADGNLDIVETPTPKVIVNEPKIKYDLTPYTDRHTFVYDIVFSEEDNNAFIYNKCCLPLIDTVFNNGNATCFAYGQTGSGKTHTMLGNNREPGLYAIAAKEIFHRAKKRGADVFVSFYEIYGRKIFDLLNNRERLHAREDGEKVINICGLSEHPVTDTQEIFDVITAGSAYRAAGVTSANSESSRSHAVLQIELRESGGGAQAYSSPSGGSRPVAGGSRRNNATIGKISFIDLAGNERGADTFDCERKTRLEGAEINKSLLALKECIRALGMGKSHIPFRGSILTEVLRDSFTGNSRTTMIATISPSASHCVNTLNTLRYTQRVKDLGVVDSANWSVGEGGAPKVETIPTQQQRRAPRRKPFEAPPPVSKRPGWVSDFVDPCNEDEEEDDNSLSPNSNASTPAARSAPATNSNAPVRGSPNSPRQQKLSSQNRAHANSTDNEVKIKDPKIANIVRRYVGVLKSNSEGGNNDEGDSEGELEEDEEDSSSGGGMNCGQNHNSAASSPERDELRQVRKVHAYLVEEISRAEEKLVMLHRRHIDAKMTGIKEEIRTMQQFEESEVVDEYVSKIKVHLEKQITDIQQILNILSSLNSILKDEEELSNSLNDSSRRR